MSLAKNDVADADAEAAAVVPGVPGITPFVRCRFCGELSVHSTPNGFLVCDNCGRMEEDFISEECSFRDWGRTFHINLDYEATHYLTQKVAAFMQEHPVLSEKTVSALRAYFDREPAERAALENPWAAQGVVKRAQKLLRLDKEDKVSMRWMRVRFVFAKMGLDIEPRVESYLRYEADKDYDTVFRHFKNWVVQTKSARKSIPFLTDIVARLIIQRCGYLAYSKVAAYWRPAKTKGPRAECQSLWEYVRAREGFEDMPIPRDIYILSRRY